MRAKIWLAVAGLTLLAGCAAGTPGPNRAAPTVGVSATQLVSAGTLTVATDPSFAPMTYLDGTTFAGFDVELSALIAKRLGLRVQYTKTSFSDLLDTLTAHRVDIVMSSMTDKAARQQRVDFVDYLNVGTSIMVRSGAPAVDGLSGLCGKRVAVQVDTMYVDFARAQQRQCPAGAPMTVVVAADPSVTLAAGQADAILNDYPIAVSEVAKRPELQITGQQIEAAPYGIAVAKDRRDLTKAVQATMYQFFRDGTYDALLAKWKLGDSALKTAAINGGA